MKVDLKHFKDLELWRSNTATAFKIDNKPTRKELNKLRFTASKTIELVREIVGCAVVVTSGKRCKELNRKIGGSSTSSHVRCEAFDFMVPGFSPSMLKSLFKQLSTSLEYDQLIFEHHNGAYWIHISWKEEDNRQQALTYEGGRYENFEN